MAAQALRNCHSGLAQVAGAHQGENKREKTDDKGNSSLFRVSEFTKDRAWARTSSPGILRPAGYCRCSFRLGFASTTRLSRTGISNTYSLPALPAEKKSGRCAERDLKHSLRNQDTQLSMRKRPSFPIQETESENLRVVLLLMCPIAAAVLRAAEKIFKYGCNSFSLRFPGLQAGES